MTIKFIFPIFAFSILLIAHTQNFGAHFCDGRVLFDSSKREIQPLSAPAAAQNINQLRIQYMKDLHSVLTEEQFEDVIKRYKNESESSLERERSVINYLNGVLTDKQAARMPVPVEFGNLPASLQTRIRTIYYGNRELTFEQKIMQIGIAMSERPEGQRLLTSLQQQQSTNDSDAKSGFVNFEVNVTTVNSGAFEKTRLLQVFDEEDKAELEKILAQNIPKKEKNAAVGALIRKVYQRNPAENNERWPGVFGTETATSPELRRAILHMMFDADPDKNKFAYIPALKQMVKG